MIKNRINYALLIKKILSQNTWIMNWSVTRHMTLNKSIFVIKRRIRTAVIIASDEVLQARWINDVRISLNDQIVRMTKVLHMLELNANLLSILTLNRRGYKVLFFKNKIEIRSSDTVIAIEIVRGRMYLFRSIDKALFSTKKLKNTDLVKAVLISSKKPAN